MTLATRRTTGNRSLLPGASGLLLPGTSGRRRYRILAGLLLVFGLTAASAPAQDGLESAIEHVQARSVKLFGAGGLKNLAGYGTGFLVSPNGHVVTVWTPLLDADVVTVVLHDGRRFFGRLTSTDARHDLALVKIEATDLPFFDLSESVSAGPGAPVLAFSNMFKVAAGDEPLSVQHGVVAARTDLSARRGRYQVPYSGPVYIVDAVTNNPGAAGGVLTTRDGRLLAMLGREVLSENTNTWLNYAMPIEQLRPVIEDMVAGRFQRTDPLSDPQSAGTVRFVPADFGLVLVPDVVQRTPAYIETVIPDSQAAQLGLQADDLIVFANGELVNSLQKLQQILGSLAPGDDLQMVVRRDNQLVSVTFRVPRPNQK